MGHVLFADVVRRPRLGDVTGRQPAEREVGVVAAGHACVLSGEQELTNHRQRRVADDDDYKNMHRIIAVALYII